MLKLDDYNKGLIYTEIKDCIDCNKCIHECPILTSNVSVADNKGNIKVCVDERECILCGTCLDTCIHNVRRYKDDLTEFLDDLKQGKEYSVLIAPAFFLSYPKESGKMLGYLKSLGVKNFYPVSFGADITSWAYINYITKNNLLGSIAQPCPSIVSYIEKHLPELLPNIIPVQSPMMCTAIYLKRYKGIKENLAFLSPCIAKKTEIKSKRGLGLINYNVTFKSLVLHIESQGVNLDEHQTTAIEDNLGMGSLFPKPGGLREIMEFYLGLDADILQIEGEHKVYKYFTSFVANANSKTNSDVPMMIDVLNCDGGCLYGTGTLLQSGDEYAIAYQALKMRKSKYKAMQSQNIPLDPAERFSLLNERFNSLVLEDFMCEYEVDNATRSYIVTDAEIETIFNEKLRKLTDNDRHVDCATCGYKTCNEMAKAIALGINHHGNCVHYVKNTLAKSEERLRILFDNMPLVANFRDKDFNILECNEEAAKLFGLRDKEEYLNRFFDLSPDTQPDGRSSKEKAEAMITRAFETGRECFEWMHRKLNGEPMPCEITLIRVDWHGGECVLAFVRDLREYIKNLENIREMEQRLKAMLDASPILCAIFDENNKVIDANQAAADLFGLSDKQIYIERYLDLCPEFQPDGMPSGGKVAQMMKLAFDTGRTNFEWMHQTLDGKTMIPCEVVLERVNLGDKRVIMTYVRDMTEFYKYRETERIAQERLQTMLDSSPLFCVVFDEYGTILDVNQAALNLYGFKTKKEYIDNFYDISPEYQPSGAKSRDAIFFLAQYLTQTAEEITIEWMQQTLTGEPLPMEVTLVLVKMEGENRIIAHAFDLRERYKLKELQDLAQQRLQVMIDSSPLVAVLYDEEGNVLEINQKVESLFEIPDKQIYIDRFHDFMPESQPDGSLSYDECFRKLHSAFKNGSTRYEWMYQTLEGKLIPCEETLERVTLGNKTFVFAYIRDLREQKDWIAKIEASRDREQAANRAKSVFLSNMSHEMRTPINAIIGMANIGKNATDTEKKDYAFEKVENASSHLLGIVNDVLDMAKIEANKFELSVSEFCFSKMITRVDNVVELLLSEKNQKLVVVIDPEIPNLLIGDEQKLAQAIINLLSNAIKFTSDEGRIELNAHFAGSRGGRCEVRINVTDTGIGMTEEHLARVFAPFEQAENDTSRKYGGTGLGLAITKSIIQVMGGDIDVESTVGKGTKFSFTVLLDYVEDAENLNLHEKSSKQGMEGPAASLKGRCILLAEDVEINREIVIFQLEDVGIEIECATNGKEAVDMFSADPEQYDLILMDVQMPEMDGLEATRRIRELEVPKARKIPIIAMTANVFNSDIAECLEAGMNDHIGKPIDSDGLLSKLENYLV